MRPDTELAVLGQPAARWPKIQRCPRSRSCCSSWLFWRGRQSEPVAACTRCRSRWCKPIEDAPGSKSLNVRLFRAKFSHCTRLPLLLMMWNGEVGKLDDHLYICHGVSVGLRLLHGRLLQMSRLGPQDQEKWFIQWIKADKEPTPQINKILGRVTEIMA